MSSNSASRSSDFVNHSHDDRLNWTPLSPIAIINEIIMIMIMILLAGFSLH